MRTSYTLVAAVLVVLVSSEARAERDVEPLACEIRSYLSEADDWFQSRGSAGLLDMFRARWIADPAKAGEPSERAPFDNRMLLAPAENPKTQWHGLIELYLWLPLFSDGTSSVPNDPSTPPAGGAGDRASVDGVSGFAIPLRLQLRRGRWGFRLEIMYADLDLDATIGSRLGVPLDLDLRFSFVDLAATYTPLVPQGTKQPWLAQVFLGARFVGFEQRLAIGSLPGVKESESYVEPLIGAYFGYELSERWALLLRLDASGFGVGSELTYNLQLGATWLFGSHRRWALGFGWRLMGIDFSTGSGSQEHSVDLTLNGPYLAVAWRF